LALPTAASSYRFDKLPSTYRLVNLSDKLPLVSLDLLRA
jgi:hypothetical protein